MPAGVLAAKPRGRRAAAELALAVAMIWGSWAVLVFGGLPPVASFVVAILLGASLAHALLVGHNANHGAMFASGWAGKAASFLLTGMTVCAPTYRQRHTRRHHAHRDDDSLADDLVSTVMRFSPQHPLRPHHRFQHIYVWPLLGIYYVNIWFVDLLFLITGRDGLQRIERPSLRRAAAHIPPKLAVTAVLLGVPLARYSWTAVVLLGAIAMFVAGVVTGVLNLIGHASELNRVPAIDDSVSPSDARVLRILAVAADLSPDRPVTRWFLGQAHGVHVAHHLWPRLSPYALYPATVSLRATCSELGLEYHSYPSVSSGMIAIYQYLKTLGRPVPARTPAAQPARTAEVVTQRTATLRTATLTKVRTSRPYLAVVSRL